VRNEVWPNAQSARQLLLLLSISVTLKAFELPAKARRVWWLMAASLAKAAVRHAVWRRVLPTGDCLLARA